MKDVLETGAVDERKRFVRAFVHEIVVDGRKRRVQLTFYDDGVGEEGPSPLAAVEAVAGRLGDLSPQLVPRRGNEPRQSLTGRGPPFPRILP